VASLREVRNDCLVKSYALKMDLRFKDGEVSVITGYLYSIEEYVL
jgi:hypothetical protein